MNNQDVEKIVSSVTKAVLEALEDKEMKEITVDIDSHFKGNEISDTVKKMIDKVEDIAKEREEEDPHCTNLSDFVVTVTNYMGIKEDKNYRKNFREHLEQAIVKIYETKGMSKFFADKDEGLIEGAIYTEEGHTVVVEFDSMRLHYDFINKRQDITAECECREGYCSMLQSECSDEQFNSAAELISTLERLDAQSYYEDLLELEEEYWDKVHFTMEDIEEILDNTDLNNPTKSEIELMRYYLRHLPYSHPAEEASDRAIILAYKNKDYVNKSKK